MEGPLSYVIPSEHNKLTLPIGVNLHANSHLIHSAILHASKGKVSHLLGMLCPRLRATVKRCNSSNDWKSDPSLIRVQRSGEMWQPRRHAFSSFAAGKTYYDLPQAGATGPRPS